MLSRCHPACLRGACLREAGTTAWLLFWLLLLPDYHGFRALRFQGLETLIPIRSSGTLHRGVCYRVIGLGPLSSPPPFLLIKCMLFS